MTQTKGKRKPGRPKLNYKPAKRTVTIHPALADQIDAIAKRDGRNQMDMLRILIVAGLEWYTASVPAPIRPGGKQAAGGGADRGVAAAGGGECGHGIPFIPPERDSPVGTGFLPRAGHGIPFLYLANNGYSGTGFLPERDSLPESAAGMDYDPATGTTK